MLKQGKYETAKQIEYGYANGRLKIRVRQDVLPFITSRLNNNGVNLYYIKIRKGENKRAILYAICTNKDVQRFKDVIQTALRVRDEQLKKGVT